MWKKTFKNKTVTEEFRPNNNLWGWLQVLSVNKPFENKTVTEVFRPNNNPRGWLQVFSVNKPFKNKTVTEVFRPNNNPWGWLQVLSVNKPFKSKTVTEVFRPNNNLWGWLGVRNKWYLYISLSEVLLSLIKHVSLSNLERLLKFSLRHWNNPLRENGVSLPGNYTEPAGEAKWRYIIRLSPDGRLGAQSSVPTTSEDISTSPSPCQSRKKTDRVRRKRTKLSPSQPRQKTEYSAEPMPTKSEDKMEYIAEPKPTTSEDKRTSQSPSQPRQKTRAHCRAQTNHVRRQEYIVKPRLTTSED